MFVLSSGTLYAYGLNRVFQIAKELGFEGVEVCVNNVYDTYDEEYLSTLVSTYEIPIVALKINNRVNQPAKIKKYVTLAENVNIPILIVRVPYFIDFKYSGWFKKSLPKLQDKTKVKIAIENVPVGKTFLLPEYSMSTLAELKKFQYVCLDTSHLVTRKVDLIRAYEMVKKHICCIHLSNWHKNHEHWVLNEGILPLESFLTKLKKDEYEGPISLKLNLEDIGGDNLKKVIKNVKKCKEFYDKYFLGEGK